MKKAQLEEAVELVEKHGLFRLDRNFNERLAALIAEVRATQPPQDERGQGLSMDMMQAIYAKAWSRAADWANRHDLHSDIGSPAYLKDMAIELAEFADAAEPERPVALSTLTAERAQFIAEEFGASMDSTKTKAAHVAAILALVASAPAQQAPAKLTRYDRDEGGMFPSESGDWVLYEKLAEQMATPPQPVAAEVEKDAARYRFLRMDAGIRNGRPFIAISSAGGISQWTGIFADKQIDAAMAGTGSDESKKGEA